MTIDVEVGGRARRVTLEPSVDGWTARVDGQAQPVSVTRVPWGWLVRSGDRAHEVRIREDHTDRLSVSVDGQSLPARAIEPRAWRRRNAGESSGGRGGARQVVAPMPGRVVKVLVKAGERVTARQGLVVVEAMKMENELRAPGDAVVREVRAAEGASVDAGAILVVLD